MLILAMVTTNMWAQTTLTLSGEGTEENPYLIGTADNWNNLADYVAEGNNCEGFFFKMTANIGTTENPITKPLGKQVGPDKLTQRNRFAGTFDGGSHTLTVNITNENNPWFEYNANYCAPFAYAKGITIKNLHVTGIITTTGQFASGLVGQSGPENGNAASKTCTIQNCHVSVTFVGNTAGNSTYGNHGTFISIAEGNVTITNSWFDGALTGLNYYYSGGFIGLNKGASTLTDCLFNPSEINITNNHIGGSSEFSRNLGGTSSLTNCYYTKSFSEPEDAQGIKVYTSYDEGSIIQEVSAPDGNMYYIILHNINWMTIQEALSGVSTTITVNLPKDIVAGTEDQALVVPNGKTVTLNLNGFTLDRGLDVVPAEVDGFVLKVENGASLTITDSSEDKTGVIKGGHNTGNGGGIYNEGTLNVTGITITSNYADMGGGIYVNGGDATINGGTIKGNKANTSNGTSGSGIFMNGGTLTLNGCTIKENNSNKNNNSYGVGVYVNNGTCNIQGNVNIKDNKCSKSKTQQNVHLTDNEVLNVTGSINRAFVRVSKGNGGIVTNGLNSYGSASNFASDSKGYTIRLKEGEIHLIPCVSITINGYGSSDGGYYLIASPFVTVNPAEVSGMTSGNFDLYAFDQAEDLEWRNYETTPFSLEAGKGYLYAKSQKVNLTLAGTPYEGNGEVSLVKTEGGNFSGWNLVGNPFSETAYIDRDYYVMNSEGSEIIAGEGNEIAAMQGLFVIAAENNETMTFSTEAPESNGEKVVLNISRNRGTSTGSSAIDRAIVRFGEGGLLPKFQIKENSTKIYFSENGQDYAVLCHANEGEMPVSFKAAEDGSYTLSVNTENVNLSYLHLVDNLTGEDVDLLQTPEYTFSANTNDYASRFRLVFTTIEKATANAEPFAYFNGNEWIVNNESISTLQVIDINGRIVSSETINGNSIVNISTTGIYTIRLIKGDEVKVQKIVVK